MSPQSQEEKTIITRFREEDINSFSKSPAGESQHLDLSRSGINSLEMVGEDAVRINWFGDPDPAQ